MPASIFEQYKIFPNKIAYEKKPACSVTSLPTLALFSLLFREAPMGRDTAFISSSFILDIDACYLLDGKEVRRYKKDSAEIASGEPLNVKDKKKALIVDLL